LDKAELHIGGHSRPFVLKAVTRGNFYDANYQDSSQFDAFLWNSPIERRKTCRFEAKRARVAAFPFKGAKRNKNANDLDRNGANCARDNSRAATACKPSRERGAGFGNEWPNREA